MVLKLELIGNSERGPGHGLLRLQGLPATDAPLDLCIRRNDPANGFLGDGGWQAQENWHQVPAPTMTDGVATVELGPALVDPLAMLARNFMVNVTVRAGGTTAQSRLVMRGLFPSQASGTGAPGASDPTVHVTPPPAPPAPPAPPVPPVHTGGEDDPVPPVTETTAPTPPVTTGPVTQPTGTTTGGGSKGPVLIAAAAAVLLLLGGAAAAWHFGLFGGAGDEPTVAEATAPEPEPQPEAAVEQPAEAAAPPVAAAAGRGPVLTREDLAAYLQQGPAVEEVTGEARGLKQAGKLDLAMLAFQHAARGGHADAALELAHMYDPKTWSADTSPMQPDAETAAYWYEPAALAGNVEAQRRLGEIMAGMTGIQRDKGVEWLTKAADAGDADARTILEGLK